MTAGAEGLVDRLAQKYLGVPVYPMRHEGDVRVTVTLRPDQIIHHVPDESLRVRQSSSA